MICVYDIGNENFDNNGDAVLTPTSATVKQVAGGNYDLTMEHPIDAEGKWAHLVPGAIVKAPVQTEVIENSFSGVEADVYRVTEPAQLREDTIAPSRITYNTWQEVADYQENDKVSFGDKNFEIKYYDKGSGLYSRVIPTESNWYRELPTMTEGAPVLVSLNTGDELYYIEDANENWYKMSTFYGVVGYIPKAQVTFDRHVSPSESKPRIITDQLFRLTDPVIDNENQKVKVTGQHVSYDLAADLIKPISIYSASPAMMMGIITGSLMVPYRGTVATNMSSDNHGTYTGEIKGKNGMFALLDPDKGLVSHFDAKFTRDNWDLFVMEKEDTDRGYRISYGVNARGISWKKSSANLITRVVPVAKDEKGEDLYLPEVWVDSEDINDYPVIMMEQIKVDGQVGKAKDANGDETWTEEDLLDEMREKAEERFTVDHADQIYQEVTIQIELVEDTAEYAWLKDLKDLLLYDIVTAVDERTGLNKKLYVSELEYDSIRKKITGIKLTNIQDYDVRTVTGFNVKNNSIGPEKLTDEVTRGLVNQAVSIMPEYSDPNAKRTADNLNTKDADGIVLKGTGNANKVWGTDSQGNPGWVGAGGVTVNDSNPTLAFGSQSKVGDVSGTDLHVTMPGAADSAKTLLNAMNEDTGTLGDNDSVAEIGSSTNVYKVKLTKIWDYIKGKISSVLGLTDTAYGGKAATAGDADTVNGKTVGTNVPANAVFTDTVTEVVDELNSTSTTKALSANQGKVLNDQAVIYGEYSSADLDTILKAGLYGCKGTTTNRPSGSSATGQLLVLEYRRSANNYYVQVYFDHQSTGSNIYCRRTTSANAGAWSAWEQINDKVSKSGDTMTGSLTLSSGYVYSVNGFRLNESDKLAIHYGKHSSGRGAQIVEYKQGDTSKYEAYRLPAIATDISTAATYNILTTKSAVTVAQGGTGSTTASGALTNLGAVAKTSVVQNWMLYDTNGDIPTSWTTLTMKTNRQFNHFYILCFVIIYNGIVRTTLSVPYWVFKNNTDMSIGWVDSQSVQRYVDVQWYSDTKCKVKKSSNATQTTELVIYGLGLDTYPTSTI